MDYLAQQAISALKKTEMDPSWIEGKAFEYKELSRIDVLRSFSNFDADNLNAICNQLNVSEQDMQATLRVLRKI